MPRRPGSAEAAIAEAEGDALAAASIIARAAAIARVTRDPYALEHVGEIIAIARGIRERAMNRKIAIQNEYPL